MNPRPRTERLESRRLLTAALDGGVLRIEGTGKSDLISVFLDASDRSVLNVRVRNDVSAFELANVQSIRVDAFGGNDRVFFNSANGAFKIPSRIYSGAGDDSVLGGAGKDRVYADAGNDTVSGGGSSDILYGGDGGDSLIGEAGDDYLSGDADNDTLLGNRGNDLISAGPGDDQVFGHDGYDTIKTEGGTDDVDGGDGDDVISE